jgi:hypothetical protein
MASPSSGYGSYTNNQFSGNAANNDFMARNMANRQAGGNPANEVSNTFQNVADNPVFSGIMGGLGSLLGGKTQVNQYATKTGEQSAYANSALQTGQYGLSQLAQIGSGQQNMYNSMEPGMGQYVRNYVNPMMSAVNARLQHSTNKYSSANTLQRQSAMMGIGSELAKAVGTERQMQFQGGLAGQQAQLSALGQITGASNNALNQSMFDTKVGKEGGLGGILGGVLGAII